MIFSRAILNHSNLLHNLEIIKNRARNSEIMPVVKANAYGHGIIPISKALRDAGIETLAVAHIEEAIELRKNGDNAQILAMIPISEYDFKDIYDYDLQFAIDSKKVIMALDKFLNKQNKLDSKVKAKLRCHIFFNSGMNREGCDSKEVLKIVDCSAKLKNIETIGLMSHFVSADDSRGRPNAFSKRQIELFENLKLEISQVNNTITQFHFCNSHAVFSIPDAHYNYVRPGLAIYGLLKNKKMADKQNLKPVLSLVSKLISIKKVKDGDTVGYNFNYIVSAKKNIGIIPLGYGDGIPTTLINQLKCLINGKRYKIIGSICMDQMAIDLGNDKPDLHSDVTIIGTNGEQEITVYDLVSKTGLLSYEITTMLKSRIKREII